MLQKFPCVQKRLDATFYSRGMRAKFAVNGKTLEVDCNSFRRECPLVAQESVVARTPYEGRCPALLSVVQDSIGCVEGDYLSVIPQKGSGRRQLGNKIDHQAGRQLLTDDVEICACERRLPALESRALSIAWSIADAVMLRLSSQPPDPPLDNVCRE
jgi:hypothetical protein